LVSSSDRRGDDEIPRFSVIVVVVLALTLAWNRTWLPVGGGHKSASATIGPGVFTGTIGNEGPAGLFGVPEMSGAPSRRDST
jgi:hypothetical protein